MDVCRLTKAQKLPFPPGVVLSLQSVLPVLDSSGRWVWALEQPLQKADMLLSAPAFIPVLCLPLFLHGCNVRWSLMILLDNKLFCCLLPVHKSLVERCLVSLLKLIFFPPFPRGRHVYFSINLLIRLQNEDGVTTLRISGPSFVSLRGDINSVGCVVGILICPAPCYGCSRDSLGGKCIL